MRAQAAADGAMLTVRDLSIAVGPNGKRVVDGLSFDLKSGDMLALVGESGSGKTMAARAMLNLVPAPLAIVPNSRILLDGRDLLQLGGREMRAVRGAEIGMVFQEPMVSLNPAITIGEQMAEGLRLHRKIPPAEIRDRSLAMLERIRIKDPQKCLAAYPHEFSGGMRQRIMLASVMLLKPRLVVADEPTTALDTLAQRDVLDLMVELTRENGTAVLLISHDLGMVAHYAPNVVVMREGKAVEAGRSAEVLQSPRHEYTKRLVDALPRRGTGGTRETPPGAPLVEIEDVVIDYGGRRRLFSLTDAKRAVDGVSLTIRRGEALALVGGSGSGKTTLGRAVVGLIRPTSGSIRFLDDKSADRHLSRQIVFQDPYSSLDPRQRVSSIIEEPLKLRRDMDKAQRRRRVAEVFGEVGLPEHLGGRFAHELSGGQRQRVAIARAIVGRPAFVVADEPVSALDMTVQKQILLLIRELQRRYGFACLFVSHDLGAVEQVADRVAVMQDGRIVELGDRDDVFDRPQHPYTRELLNAAMLLDRRFGDDAQLPRAAAR